MFNRLLQAATLTFLLNLLAYISPPERHQSSQVLSPAMSPKLVLSFR
ncbi:hypothetical protein [Allocoleopsis franciscana]|uniref:Uncharacterized protein n=1 Tax=Allocoleopsis franciscana PCC 7113 TaxID=1173027 RepID=K9WIC4_9CYAN|nr:hypothetical protein [Allocoleopsis franciscana]AFZ19529.1 hypothetical protein Mic7113_3812 [Allocoleopsis franciscana PCC 7113]